jgi:hypothetical protein
MSKGKGVTVRLYEKPCFSDGGLASAAEATRQAGRWGDEILIHVNPEEFAQMQQMWGEPTLNPHTGLPEYGFLSKLWKGLKKVLKVVAPIALNVFAPGAGTALGSALGLGATAGKALLGAGLGALNGGSKGALIGGLTGGLGGGAGIASKLSMGQGALQTAFGDALASGAMTSAMGGKFGEGALTGGLSSLALPYLNNAFAGTETGSRLGLSQMPTLTSPLGQMAALQEVTPTASRHVPVGPEAPGALSDMPLEEVLVQGSRLGAPELSGAGLSSAVPYLSSQASVAANSVEAPDVGATDPGPEVASTPAEGSFLQKAFGAATKNPLQAATALMMLRGLTAEQPEVGDEAATAPTQRGFGDPLPQFIFNRTQQPQQYIDYYTYGRRPEVNFYLNNQQPGPAATGMAAGGLALLGDGGRSDMIDARLSEGEYVVDAETVALLGDGSTAAGAKKLDALRKNIRTHKGKALAKGKISPNAKPAATDYLRG